MELEKETVVRGKHRKNKKMIKMANFCEGCGKRIRDATASQLCMFCRHKENLRRALPISIFDELFNMRSALREIIIFNLCIQQSQIIAIYHWHQFLEPFEVVRALKKMDDERNCK